MYNIRNLSNVNYETTFGLFAQLNTDELKALLNDDSKLDDLIKDDKQCKDIEKEKEMLLVSNRSLAEFNLSKEPTLMVLKSQLVELNEQCESLYRNVEEKFYGSGTKNGSTSLDTKLSLLQMAASELEEETEKVAETFLDGDSDLDDFLEKFIARRKIMHSYKVKADKMAEIISQQNQISNQSISYNMPQNCNGAIRYPY